MVQHIGRNENYKQKIQLIEHKNIGIDPTYTKTSTANKKHKYIY